jgi:hypothetical protein
MKKTLLEAGKPMLPIFLTEIVDPGDCGTKEALKKFGIVEGKKVFR